MKIAFTHNLQVTSSEDEAEFDTPETVAAIAAALTRLGHHVELVEVSGPASRLVARLEALAPDLVFNTAEGRVGRYREAFYPGLFDQLSLPYTGSDAWVCTLTLDKKMTKLLVEAHGIPTPRWCYVERVGELAGIDLRFPVIVKPNFEGSSKGITQESVVEDLATLRARTVTWLERYPSGLLIEEYILGEDVVVPFIEGVSPETGGVLAPVAYVFADAAVAGRRWNVYDYELKHADSAGVDVRVPADLPADVARDIGPLSRDVFRVLGVRDLGRIDWRLGDDGKLYFIEVNALPSLEPGAGIYAAAALAGLSSIEAVLGAVVASAVRRRGITPPTSRSRRRPKLRVGVAFNLKRAPARKAGDDDSEAEFDSRATIDALSEAISSYGHEVVELEATPELPTVLPSLKVDLVFNVAEGMRGRNREAQVPALLELLDVPYTGSDPAALSITLDKGLAKRIVGQAGIATPAFALGRLSTRKLPAGMSFPVIVKPLAEGSSKGVIGSSVVHDDAQLRERVREIVERYQQPALIEAWLPGREFTVGLLGERRPKVLPPMEIIFSDDAGNHPVYGFEEKLTEGRVRCQAPAEVSSALGRDLARVARGAFIALGCRDVARVDIRLDHRGKAHFIECNPLPGMTPGWSDLCLIAQGAGMDYRTLVGEIMAPALRRVRHAKAPAGSAPIGAPTEEGA